MWKYKIGTVVQQKSLTKEDTKKRPMFGHVVKFANNGFGAILVVRWDDGLKSLIHPDNVLTEEDVEFEDKNNR